MELPKREKEKVAKNINPRYVILLIFGAGFFYMLAQQGAFGSINSTQLIMVVAGTGIVIWFLYTREKKEDVIPPEKAVVLVENYAKFFQRRDKLPQGQLIVPAIYTLRKIGGVPKRYEWLVKILRGNVINEDILAHLDCYNGRCDTIIPKPQGWSPEESPDYFVVSVPSQTLERGY